MAGQRFTVTFLKVYILLFEKICLRKLSVCKTSKPVAIRIFHFLFKCYCCLVLKICAYLKPFNDLVRVIFVYPNRVKI